MLGSSVSVDEALVPYKGLVSDDSVVVGWFSL
jgi:hypothetical protein